MTTATFLKPTMKTLRQAVTLRREANELRRQAKGCRGFKSSDDRKRLADQLHAKALWLAGKVSTEAYRESLVG